MIFESHHLVVRIWCSPGTPYPWRWAIGDNRETIEWGWENTEKEARDNAAEAKDSWHMIFNSNFR